eukprot:1088921-Rhodomonas_salina.1
MPYVLAEATCTSTTIDSEMDEHPQASRHVGSYGTSRERRRHVTQAPTARRHLVVNATPAPGSTRVEMGEQGLRDTWLRGSTSLGCVQPVYGGRVCLSKHQLRMDALTMVLRASQELTTRSGS